MLDAVDLLNSAGARSMGGDRSAIMPAIPNAHEHRHPDNVGNQAHKETHRGPPILLRRRSGPRRHSKSVAGRLFVRTGSAYWGGPTNQLLYRFRPTRLTPPFASLPTFCRTAARATGRGLSTAPALTTQPAG